MSVNPVRKRAEQARAILENELFAGTLADMDAALVARWRVEKDPAEREMLFHRQQALAELRGALLDHINRAAAEDVRDGVTGGAWRAIWNKLK